MNWSFVYNSSWRGWDGGAQIHAGGGDSVEESLHGGPQRQEYAGWGSIQLGEVHLCRGFFTVLAGGCRGNSKPAGKYKKGIIPIRKRFCNSNNSVCIYHISGIWYFKQNSLSRLRWNFKWSYWLLLSYYHCYLKFTSPSRIRQLITHFVMLFFFLFF